MKDKAIRFEKSDVSRTFLVLDEEELFTEEEKFKIIGYFALSLKSIEIPENMGKSKRRKLDGINKNCTSIICYLIGQLGKDDMYGKVIRGKEILNYALESLVNVKSVIGKRVVLVECEKQEKLKKFYQNNEFEYIGDNEEGNLFRFIRLLK